jgi:hypothetical protein
MKTEFEVREAVINNLVGYIEDIIFCDNENGKDEEDIYTELEENLIETLDDMLMYYHTQFDVVNALRTFTEFEDNELGLEINSIGQLAFAMLYDFATDRELVGHAIDRYNEKTEVV